MTPGFHLVTLLALREALHGGSHPALDDSQRAPFVDGGPQPARVIATWRKRAYGNKKMLA